MSSALTDADQDAGLREEIACCLARQDGWSDPHALYTENFSVIAAGGAGDPVWWDYRENADAIMRGPLATLRARATAAEAELRDREAEIERLTGENDMLREVQEAVIARWRGAAFLAVNGDMKRLQRLLMASQSRIAGSALASTEPHASSEEAIDAQ